MGLKDKKLIEEINTTHMPGVIKWVNGFYGQELPFEVDFESFGEFAENSRFSHGAAATDRICREFFSALSNAVKNSVVEEEFKKQVQKIVFTCKEGEPEVALNDGTLHVKLPYKDEDFRPKHTDYNNWIESVL